MSFMTLNRFYISIVITTILLTGCAKNNKKMFTSKSIEKTNEFEAKFSDIPIPISNPVKSLITQDTYVFIQV